MDRNSQSSFPTSFSSEHSYDLHPRNLFADASRLGAANYLQVPNTHQDCTFLTYNYQIPPRIRAVGETDLGSPPANYLTTHTFPTLPVTRPQTTPMLPRTEDQLQNNDLSQITMRTLPSVREQEVRIQLLIPRNWINTNKKVTMDVVRQELISCNGQTTQEEIMHEFDRKNELILRVKNMTSMVIQSGFVQA